MKIVSMFLSFLLIFVSVQPAALAQALPEASFGSWENVRALPEGDELSVDLKDGSTVKGKLVSTSDTKLRLTRKKKETEIDRADVRRVHRVSGKSKGKSTLIGFGVGAGAGTAIGGVISARGEHESGEAHVPVVLFGVAGAGLGALTGFLLGLGKKRVLVYEARN